MICEQNQTKISFFKQAASFGHNDLVYGFLEYIYFCFSQEMQQKHGLHSNSQGIFFSSLLLKTTVTWLPYGMCETTNFLRNVLETRIVACSLHTNYQNPSCCNKIILLLPSVCLPSSMSSRVIDVKEFLGILNYNRPVHLKT